jgi:hypothetical protein
MKKCLAVLPVVAALAFTASASAAVRPHTCYVAGGTVAASGYTSCPFAANIARAWDRGINSGRCHPSWQRACRGWVFSPVTGNEYRVTCRTRNPVRCTTSGVDSWIQFWWHRR